MIGTEDLKVGFRSKLTSQRHEAEHRLLEFKDTFERIKVGEQSKIEAGSRVLITYEHNGSQQEGRVINVKSDGTVQVNRDGYKSLINVDPSQVQNLSVGTYGLLEKEIWLIEEKLDAINNILKDSDIPGFFFNVRDNIVYASNIIRDNLFQFVDLVHAKDLRSYRLKLPVDTITKHGYYHIKCNEVDIQSVNMSSEFAFKEFYNRQ